MPLLLIQDRAIFGTEVPIARFPQLLRVHQQRFPNTRKVELLGDELIENDFSAQRVAEFVKEVCDWGGYSGIGGRVLKRNSPNSIAESLRVAFGCLREDPSNSAAAISAVNSLNSLGTPSFASKHLRFLCPELCPVFDSLLQEALPYSFDAGGFSEFARDCSTLAATLNARGISGLDYRPDGKWFVADVEASLYAHVTGLGGDGG